MASGGGGGGSKSIMSPALVYCCQLGGEIQPKRCARRHRPLRRACLFGRVFESAQRRRGGQRGRDLGRICAKAQPAGPLNERPAGRTRRRPDKLGSSWPGQLARWAAYKARAFSLAACSNYSCATRRHSADRSIICAPPRAQFVPVQRAFTWKNAGRVGERVTRTPALV